MESFEINQVDRSTKDPKFDSLYLTFTEDKAKHICRSHDDTLMVTMTLEGLKVYQILVDNGSLVNVLYKQALDKMKIGSLVVRLVNTPLSRFTGSPIMPVGKAILSLSMGELSNRVIEMIEFLVVDHPLAYSAILVSLAMHSFKAIPSTYHMAIKFLTRCGGRHYQRRPGRLTEILHHHHSKDG